jgi:hypothetical protein
MAAHARNPPPLLPLSARNEGGSSMPVSNLTLVERIARVLAGRDHSINAEGDDPSAGPTVDETWHEHVDDALAILRTMREPDQVMAAAGDPEVWERMVEAALNVERAVGNA